MKYIKITNTVNEVNRLKLEKLGFSTKRDDSSTIGQFGSGIKFAPISAIRKGIEFSFAGRDHRGSYVLNYIVQDDEGIPSIFYNYGDYVKPSSFTVDAGTLSWNDEFQIFREVVANAIDEAKISKTDWTIDVVEIDNIQPVDGEFSVYLTATDKMIELFEDFDKYFSINRQPIYSNPSGSIKLYHPIDNSLRVYSKGVLVYSSAHRSERFNSELMSGIFDYEFDNLDLNEERSVKSEYQMNNNIIHVMNTVDDNDLISRIIENLITTNLDSEAESGFYETSCISGYMFGNAININEKWIDEFEKLYPKNVLIHGDFASINQKLTIKARGFHSLTIYNEIAYNILTRKGIKTLLSVLGSDFIYDFTTDWDNLPNLSSAVGIIRDVYEEYTEVLDYIGVFDDSDDEDNGILGLTTMVNLNPEGESSNLTKVMLIAKSHAENSEIKEIIGTLIHEWDHYRTSIKDGDIEGRMFRELADNRIGQLIYDYWFLREVESGKTN